MAYEEESIPEPEFKTLPPVEMVQIFRKVPVAAVDIGEDGSVPFEVAVLTELAQALLNSNSRNNVVNVADGAMHDSYEATWKGHSVSVKLGDFATEDV